MCLLNDAKLGSGSRIELMQDYLSILEQDLVSSHGSRCATQGATAKTIGKAGKGVASVLATVRGLRNSQNLEITSTLSTRHFDFEGRLPEERREDRRPWERRYDL